jgi:hypothetical protein
MSSWYITVSSYTITNIIVLHILNLESKFVFFIAWVVAQITCMIAMRFNR